MSQQPEQIRRVGVTGPNGFVAQQLIARLCRDNHLEPILWPRSAWDSPTELAQLAGQCDVIVHLAGMNRGQDQEIYETNVRLAQQLTQACLSARVTPHVVFASTTQREADNVYGRSKREAERLLTSWAEESGASLTSLVIPNVYGAGCRPFYNSVVATFCHQLTHGEQPQVIQDREVEFLWVEHLVDRIVDTFQNLQGVTTRQLQGPDCCTVKQLLAILQTFRDDFFERGVVSDLSDPFHSRLYTTFLSYLEMDSHRHCPPLHEDNRGQLCEVIKLANAGQIFFSTTKPGIERGNHYHTRKIEWFCVVQGEASIRLRKVGQEKIQEFRVRGSEPQFISIPTMHTHSIQNVGDTELLTIFWTNELFDAADPDTYYENVVLEESPTVRGVAA